MLEMLAERWRRERLRSESELNSAIGVPIISVRPLEEGVPRQLCRQLLENWFRPGRPLLAVVSAQGREGRTSVAARLAQAFAGMGEPTLLVDADFRAPALHRAFRLPNHGGLADYLEGRKARIAQCSENLSVLVAGRSRTDPLELLSRDKLRDLIAAASLRYRVILFDTPAAARGPDLQMFAALAGGALVIAKRPAKAPALERLRDLLKACSARVVGTVLSPG